MKEFTMHFYLENIPGWTLQTLKIANNSFTRTAHTLWIQQRTECMWGSGSQWWSCLRSEHLEAPGTKDVSQGWIYEKLAIVVTLGDTIPSRLPITTIISKKSNSNFICNRIIYDFSCLDWTQIIMQHI